MDLPNPNLDELLSGMLDGTLSDQELRLLERAMADDPSLELKFEEMSTARNALLRGRSRGRLGPDFARSVVAQARQQALVMGPDAPEWLVPQEFERPNVRKNPAAAPAPRPMDNIPAVKRFWVYSCVGLAAGLALLFVLIREPQNQGLALLDPKPSITSAESELAVIEKAEEILAASPGATENAYFGTDSGNVPGSLQDVSPQSTLAAANTQSTLATANTQSTVATASPEVDKSPTQKKQADQIASSSTPSKMEAVQPTTVASSEPTTVASAEPKKTKPKKTKVDSYLTTAIYITIDDVAMKNRALEIILEEYGIVYSTDHVLNDDELSRLAESGLVSKIEEQSQGNLQVLFLKSTVENIGLAMETINRQDKDFPQLLMSMTTDPSASKLAKQLSQIEVAESPKGFAKRIVPSSGDAGNYPFVVSLWRNGNAPLPKNAGAPLSPLMIAERQQMAYALIFIRPSE